MEKIVDFQKTVYDICTEDPFIIEIMKELGFDQITKQGMLQTAGRVMTIAKGARMKGIELSDIIQTFAKHGYSVKQ
ncbi:DUF1858 domain-containing protein [Bacillus sp. V3B]|uniref:DUF1858 domain-containing protein n=1 Tax=Bacillus sp. V3B TaxID=2804915 RepID=UPI00210DAB50|nr:DUF1858 domain-containing protein [Bacillus sp. V3B]MCQ6276827.1 DUF1858 domain-containing protein [Bacillus sp. V3B]